MGGWKDACDAQSITSDRWQELAACWVAEAVLMAANGYQTSTKLAVLQAGAYIRAWRKSLTEPAARMPDVPSAPLTGLLWGALEHVCEAQYWQTLNDPSGAAHSLRLAEGLLRTWWKRQVAS